MEMKKTHWMLCAGDDFGSAHASALAFFNKSILLSYDALRAIEHASCSAEDSSFWEGVEGGITANRLVLRGFLDDLRAEGCQHIDDLAALPLGYPSKLLHLISHLLDGFIGIDSVFYNLVEDSHWLSEKLREKIRQTPTKYWLVRIEASFMSAETASFIHIMKNKA